MAAASTAGGIDTGERLGDIGGCDGNDVTTGEGGDTHGTRAGDRDGCDNIDGWN